jgi:adenosylcobinamide kinase/adenosylcobinamide-phosphate guanylyltransferase
MSQIISPPAPRLELVLGGARSGKSRYAEARAAAAAAAGLRVVYVATAEARDDEMADRIAHHRARRPVDWALVESPLHLASALREHAAADRFVLVDCLTLWLSNLLFAGRAAAQADAGQPVDCPLFRDERAALLNALAALPGQTILVSNEVGWGIVPMGAVSRLFADEQGRLNQDVAALADRVTLVAAGLPLALKGGLSR